MTLNERLTALEKAVRELRAIIDGLRRIADADARRHRHELMAQEAWKQPE